MKFETKAGGESIAFSLEKRGDKITVSLDGSTSNLSIVPLTPHSYSLLINGKSFYLGITKQADGYKVIVDQNIYPVQIKNEMDLLLERIGIIDHAEAEHGEIRAPIPGLVSNIFIAPDQIVNQGDKLLILEAMKMENEIYSPISGVISDVSISAGQSVEKDDLLVTIFSEKYDPR